MKKLTKKQIATILGAIATVATIIASMLSGGCTSIRGQKLSNAVGEVAHATSIICDAAQTLTEEGADIPGVEQCDEILPVLNSDEMSVVVSVLQCADESKIKSPEFTECAARAGWPILKTRLQQLKK